VGTGTGTGTGTSDGRVKRTASNGRVNGRTDNVGRTCQWRKGGNGGESDIPNRIQEVA